MKEAQQYWKPGDAKPAVGEANSSGAAAAPRVKIEGARKSSKSKGDREERGGSGGEPKKRRKAGKGKEGRDRKVKGELPSISKAKSPAAGPSRTLLAMKFMQRKAKIDEAQQQQQDRRDKLERDFSSAYAKRLKADKGDEKDRLICRTDEQDPTLVVIGRRSFGGFNSVAEAAYHACIREIAAGARLGQPRGGSDGGDEDGVSDSEMAERLGKNVRRGGW